MSVRLEKHGPILATMSVEKLQKAYSVNNKKRNVKIRKELQRRGASLLPEAV